MVKVAEPSVVESWVPDSVDVNPPLVTVWFAVKAFAVFNCGICFMVKVAEPSVVESWFPDSVDVNPPLVIVWFAVKAFAVFNCGIWAVRTFPIPVEVIVWEFPPLVTRRDGTTGVPCATG